MRRRRLEPFRTVRVHPRDPAGGPTDIANVVSTAWRGTGYRVEDARGAVFWFPVELVALITEVTQTVGQTT